MVDPHTTPLCSSEGGGSVCVIVIRTYLHIWYTHLPAICVRGLVWPVLVLLWMPRMNRIEVVTQQVKEYRCCLGLKVGPAGYWWPIGDLHQLIGLRFSQSSRPAEHRADQTRSKNCEAHSQHQATSQRQAACGQHRRKSSCAIISSSTGRKWNIKILLGLDLDSPRYWALHH